MRPQLVSALVAVGFVLCWSSGFVGGRLATETSTPVFALFAWRFMLASALAGAWWWLVRNGRRITWRAVRHESAIGCLTMGGYLLGVIMAIQLGVSTGVVALIAALQPPLAAALAGRWLGERLPLSGWVGMAIATVGVGLCVIGDLETNARAPGWAYALPLFSVLSVTLGSVLAVRSTRADTYLPMAPTLMAQLAAAALVFTLAALLAGGGRMPLPTFDSLTLVAMAWLIVLSSFGGYGFFVASLRRLGVTLTSTLVYLTPPVTLAWAAVFFDEWPGVLGLIGMAIAVAGVVLASLQKQRRPVVSARPDNVNGQPFYG